MIPSGGGPACLPAVAHLPCSAGLTPFSQTSVRYCLAAAGLEKKRRGTCAIARGLIPYVDDVPYFSGLPMAGGGLLLV